MALFDFMKEAGEKLFGRSGAAGPAQQAAQNTASADKAKAVRELHLPTAAQARATPG